MNRPYAIAVVGAIAVVAAVVFSISQPAGGSETESGRREPTAPATVEAPPVFNEHRSVPDPKSNAASSPSPETRQALETLLHKLNDSRSYRQFIAAALKAARHGGIIYATEASQLCDKFQSARDSTKPQATSNQALQSAALLEARCDITSDEFFAQLSATTTADKVLESDPLFAMLVPNSSGKSREDSLRQARALLDSGDPIAMESLVHLDFRDPLGETPYFDGHHYRSPAERNLMDDAWLLVECSLGLICDAEATQTLLLCATRDWCGSGVAEAMEIGRGPDGTFSQVQTLANSLLSAIRSKRAAAFVPAG